MPEPQQRFARQLGLRMKSQRERLGLQQADVARHPKVNVPVDTYGSWERGYRLVPTHKLAGLAEALATTVDYLLGLPDPAHIDEDERTLLEVRRSIHTANLRQSILEHALQYQKVEQELSETT